MLITPQTNTSALPSLAQPKVQIINAVKNTTEELTSNKTAGLPIKTEHSSPAHSVKSKRPTDPFITNLKNRWGKQRADKEKFYDTIEAPSSRQTPNQNENTLLDFYTTEKPFGYDSFVKKITGFDFKEEAKNNPKSTLITPQQAREAAGALLGNALDTHAQYHAMTKHLNLTPRTTPDAREKQTPTQNTPKISEESGIIDSIPIIKTPIKVAFSPKIGSETGAITKKIAPKRSKRVKRVVDGDEIHSKSPLYKSVGWFFIPESRFCTASVIAPNKVLTAAHCLNPEESPNCKNTTQFPKAWVKINGYSYPCKNYTLNNDCYNFVNFFASYMVTNPRESMDAVICTTYSNMRGVLPLKIMAKEDFQQLYLDKASYYDGNTRTEAMADVVLIGGGMTGKDCKQEPSSYLQSSWMYYKGYHSGKTIGSARISIKKIEDTQTEKNYHPCSGDSGGPVLFWNKQNQGYELGGILVTRNSESANAESLLSQSGLELLKKAGIQLNVNDTHETLLFRDESVAKHPYLSVSRNDYLNTTIDTKSMLVRDYTIYLNNNITSHQTLYLTQPLRHLGHNRTLSLKIFLNKERKMKLYSGSSVGRFTVHNNEWECAWRWNMTALLLNDDPTSKKIKNIYGATQYYKPPDNTPGNWHYTPMNLTFIDGEKGTYNITACTVPAHLLIQDKGNCTVPAHLLIQDKGDCTPCKPELSKRSSSATLASILCFILLNALLYRLMRKLNR